MLYLIKADNGLIKIGVSTNAERRLAQIAGMSPINVKLIATGQDDIHEETLHSLLADRCVHGEWFDLTPAIIDTIVHVFDLTEKNISYRIGKNVTSKSRNNIFR